MGTAYLRGDGVKQSKYRAARWLREADKQGRKIVGESWIWKSKYDGTSDGEPPGKKERRKMDKEERRARKERKKMAKEERKRGSASGKFDGPTV
ncbi:hypothetical protein HDV00_000136 [Rhizophlyctis rosea]|nr:hypothetical protein HDV00_000136 [Rhizophlyctis rosea]